MKEIRFVDIFVSILIHLFFIRLASVAVEDWSQEIKLVEDFVSTSNNKATPSREELNQFSKR